MVDDDWDAADCDADVIGDADVEDEDEVDDDSDDDGCSPVDCKGGGDADAIPLPCSDSIRAPCGLCGLLLLLPPPPPPLATAFGPIELTNNGLKRFAATACGYSVEIAVGFCSTDAA